MIPWNLFGEGREKIEMKGIKEYIYSYLLSFYGKMEGMGGKDKV